MQNYILTYREALRTLERQQRPKTLRNRNTRRAEYITADESSVIFLDPPQVRKG